jgi:hypothetical protein
MATYAIESPNLGNLQHSQTAAHLIIELPSLTRARAYSRQSTVARERTDALRHLCGLPPKMLKRKTAEKGFSEKTLERMEKRDFSPANSGIPILNPTVQPTPLSNSYSSSPRLSSSLGSSFGRNILARRRRQQDPELELVEEPTTPIMEDEMDSEEEAFMLALESPNTESMPPIPMTRRDSQSPSLRSRRQIARAAQRQRVHSGRFGAEMDVDLIPGLPLLQPRRASLSNRTRPIESDSESSDF